VSDYIDLAWRLIEEAKQNGIGKDVVVRILKERAESTQRTGENVSGSLKRSI
jgi:hypothetical protein